MKHGLWDRGLWAPKGPWISTESFTEFRPVAFPADSRSMAKARPCLPEGAETQEPRAPFVQSFVLLFPFRLKLPQTLEPQPQPEMWSIR